MAPLRNSYFDAFSSWRGQNKYFYIFFVHLVMFSSEDFWVLYPSKYDLPFLISENEYLKYRTYSEISVIGGKK